ncbi:hypothetical protein [Streptomyces sp. NPDC004284]|uniref:hypothetical protein n=1 Tax=Streptomyces sp. NPDC004284 TaxID=3364695 RepID=UPI0036BF0C22
MTRRQMTDAEREFIDPHLPIGAYGSYPSGCDNSPRTPSGGSGRPGGGEPPTESGAWSTVHDRFRQRRAAGVGAGVGVL